MPSHGSNDEQSGAQEAATTDGGGMDDASRRTQKAVGETDEATRGLTGTSPGSLTYQRHRPKASRVEFTSADRPRPLD
jgi:hypothetical protein